MSEPRENEIVIEIDNEVIHHYEPIVDMTTGEVKEERDPTRSGNNNYYFFPVEKPLRSRFVPLRCGSPPMPLVNIEYIPGQRVHLDMAAREGRITDGLSDKRNQELFRRIQRAWKACEIAGPMGQPIKDEVVGLQNDETYWTWIYWMKKCLHGVPPNERFAIPIQNTHKLPSIEEIVKSGKVRLPIYDAGARLVAGVDSPFMTPEMAGVTKERSQYEYGQEDQLANQRV